MSKILVFGGTRFFGKELIKELIINGHDITIATRGIRKDNFGDKVKRILVDKRDENALIRALDGQKLVHLQSDVNYLNISIKDNGWGIPAKYKKRVFNNFFRVKRQNNKKIQGYGIGLGRVRSIIQAHNGTVNLDCPQEGGTVVAFQIPLL